MPVDYKKGKDNFPLMERSVKTLSNKTVDVGHLDGGENAWLAGIHEYGCRIKITPKMRAWLHLNGLHVKDSTTEIVIPERSFLRSGFDAWHEKVVKLNEKALAKCLADGDVDTYVESVGQMLRDKIVDYGIELSTPPKHPFTLERHPSKTNPLVVSGDMLNALTFDVT